MPIDNARMIMIAADFFDGLLMGFTPEKLDQLQTELNDDGELNFESGFGIGNVNKRIRLYYGKQYGLTVQSEYHVGTCATLIIPARQSDTIDFVVAPAME